MNVYYPTILSHPRYKTLLRGLGGRESICYNLSLYKSLGCTALYLMALRNLGIYLAFLSEEPYKMSVTDRHGSTASDKSGRMKA